MSDREKKYLDDEQVKKNLDKFNNDREKFLKDSSHLDNLGISYKRKEEVIKMPKKGIGNSKGNKKGEKEDEIRVPITLSIICIILISFVTFMSYGDGSGFSGLAILLLWGIPFVLLIIWLSYGVLLHFKNKLSKKKKSDSNIGWILVLIFIFSLLIFPYILSFLFSH